MSATEKTAQSFSVTKSPSAIKGKALFVHNPNDGDPTAIDAETFLKIAFKDLSMYDIFGGSNLGRSTANCYVIRTAGAYRIPLVYGNLLKNGQPNMAACTYNGGGNQARFVNHLGNEITSPFIEANAGCAPGSCAIVWSDVNDLVTDLELAEGGDCKYLQFTVRSVPSTNGNAILAVRDTSGRIMWSWHIWVTMDDLTPEQFTNRTPRVYEMMPLNLGWKWDSADRIKGKNPHYQWGRKDPMPCPASYASGANTTLYNNAYTFEATAADTVAEAIKRPYNFFMQYDEVSYNWNPLTHFWNFWDANCNAAGASDNDSVKTIYDPSPVGFKVPPGRAFTGFTTTGSNSEDATAFNVIGNFTNGWVFKRFDGDTKGNFFAASGYRYRTSGALADVGGYGSYWSSAASSQANAYSLDFRSGGVYPLINSSRAYGFSVRCVRE